MAELLGVLVDGVAEGWIAELGVAVVVGLEDPQAVKGDQSLDGAVQGSAVGVQGVVAADR